MIPLSAAAILITLCVLHLYWAVGGKWPGTSSINLNEIVVGGAPRTQPPSSLACAIVAICLAVASWVTLATRGFVSPLLSAELNRWAAWGLVAVLTLRGLGGYLETHIRPSVIGTPYARLNLILYSPLCLMLAAMVSWSVLS
ncbi:MAG: DUF3995 domain-containing protein [Pleurocapsa sp. SU_196_0]|nr:DUF3995 domain-containing protein [Pleurocapsa sp. SU_196_0]